MCVVCWSLTKETVHWKRSSKIKKTCISLLKLPLSQTFLRLITKINISFVLLYCFLYNPRDQVTYRLYDFVKKHCAILCYTFNKIENKNLFNYLLYLYVLYYNVEWYSWSETFFSCILYTGPGNLVLEHFILKAMRVGWGTRFVSGPERENANLKYFISQSRNWTQNRRVNSHVLVPLGHNGFLDVTLSTY